MRFAATMPALMYPIFDGVSKYHLAQAHHIAEHDDVMKWFDAASRDGHMVIIDNGVMELGEPDMDAMTYVARRVMVDIVVCPDTFNDHDATIALFEKHFASCLGMAGTVMAVPHGATVAECVDCAVKMYSFAALACKLDAVGRLMFGMPKVLDRIAENGREDCIIQILAALSTTDFDISKFHLLGAWGMLAEPMRTNLVLRGIFGCDSTFPVAYGLDGIEMVHPYMTKHVITNWNAGPGDISLASAQVVMRNILAAQRWMNL